MLSTVHPTVFFWNQMRTVYLIGSGGVSRLQRCVFAIQAFFPFDSFVFP